MNYFKLSVFVGFYICAVTEVKAGILCYKCELLPHQRDCDHIIECGDNEMCYGERMVTDDGITTFRSGCKPKQMCTTLDSSSLLFGKRNDIVSCSKCCNTSYCNTELCDQHIESFGMRCLSCIYAMKPSDCFVSIQCNAGEICYTQTILHNHERRFRLGCIKSEQCESKSTGKRDDDEYCGQCCSEDNCNREICSNSSIAHVSLGRPPALQTCRDNDTDFCVSQTGRCNENYFKNYLCPYTCGQCGVHVIDYCANSPCGRNGLCNRGLNGFTCTCSEGYIGAKCETEVNECASNPCENGGSCQDHVGNFTCNCRHGYTGRTCKTECAAYHNLRYNGHCYYFTNLKKPWKSTLCGSQSRHMYHAIINSPDENAAITNFLSRINHTNELVWIGGTFSNQMQRWIWVNNETISMSEPQWQSHHNPSHNSCMLFSNGRWTNDNCNHEYHHLCERPLIHPTIKPSSHFTTTTRPKTAVCDGKHRTGHKCYLLIQNKHNWTEAVCKTNGMKLATVSNDEEHKAIVQYVRNILHYDGFVWLGGRSDHHNNWRWYIDHDSSIIDPLSKHWKISAHQQSRGCVSLDNLKWGRHHCFHEFYHLCEHLV